MCPVKSVTYVRSLQRVTKKCLNHHVSSSLIPVCGLGRHTLKNGALFCKKLYLNLIACIWSSIVRKSEGYCARSQSCVVVLPSAIATKLLQRLLYVTKSVGLNSRLMSSYVISSIVLISCLHCIKLYQYSPGRGKGVRVLKNVITMSPQIPIASG